MEKAKYSSNLLTIRHPITKSILNSSNKLQKQSADIWGWGAYDRVECYQANFKHGSSAIIPPQRNARYKINAPESVQERNKALLEISGLGGNEEGRSLWKKLKGYHRRSLAETGMYRFKALFGGNLKSRTIQGQQAEVYIKSQALNILTNLGMPQSERMAA